MQSDVIVNVKDTSSDIVVPDTSADTPNTGYLGVDSNIGVNTNASDDNMLALGVMSVIILAAIAVLIIITKKYHIKFIFNRGKHATRLLISLAILTSVFSFVGLKNLNNSYNSASAEGDNTGQQGNTSTREGALVINTDNSIVNIDLDDEPVFAYAKNTISVTSPTMAGYTLAAYIDGDTKDLANVTNTEAADARIAGLTSSEPQALTDNTWGFALQEPESKDSEVFSSLPTDGNTPLIIKTECATTESDDETDVYIGAYVVPGLPEGTYSGVTVNYVAVANIVSDDITVDFHGNGLFFDGEQTQNENTVVYGYLHSAVDVSEQGACGIITKSGTYMNTFNSDNSTWYSLINNPDASNPNDTLGFNGEDGVKDYLNEKHDEYEGQTMDLYATKNYIIHYDANGGEGQMADQVISAVGYLTSNKFTNGEMVFTGWNTEADGSGASYKNTLRVTQLAKPGQTVTLYAQWADCFDKYICYRANGDDVVGTMPAQSTEYGATLSMSSYKRDGYGFAGWNTKADYTGVFYGPNQDISSSLTSPNGLYLYAVWVPSAGTIQNWSGCASLTKAPVSGANSLSYVTALTDERDGNTYVVAKLADGKCWTVENLKLDSTAELSAANTHNPSLPLTNIYSTSLTSNHLTPSSSVAYNVDTAPEGWCNSSSASCVNQSRLRIDRSFGGYYNYYSATAGHGKYSGHSGTVAGDICPAGWRLPTGGSTSGEFKALTDAMNGGANNQTTSNRIRSFPFNFFLSGGVTGNGGIEFAGYTGDYWSSSTMTGAGAYSLRLATNRVDYGITGGGLVTYRGAAVRCIASN